jgi:uncharacterized protein YbjT (DUF2867 family)
MESNMTSGVVLVTGAAGGSQGQTGRQVSELLLARGVSVRAFVRRIDHRSERLRALGAEVIEGDFLDYHSVARAAQGVSSVYFAYPVQEGLLEASAIMADAARKAGVTRLIDMVMLVSSPDAPTPRMRENYLSERIFEWAGIGAAHVRATLFYENIRALTRATIARDGSILLPWGSESTLVPLVSAQDVAGVAVGLLTSPSLSPGTSFPVIGDVLTLRDILATFQQVLGRSVRYQEVPDKAWADVALSHGFNQHAVEHLSKLWQALRAGTGTYEIPDTILKLAGKSPKTFEEFLQEQKDAFQPQLASASA